MKEYIIDNQVYFTICSINDELVKIFENIEKIDVSSYRTKKDLFNHILNEIKNSKDFLKVSKEMGQNMESALRYKQIWGQKINIFEEDGED